MDFLKCQKALVMDYKRPLPLKRREESYNSGKEKPISNDLIT